MTGFVLRYDLRAPSIGAPASELYAAALEQCAWGDQRGAARIVLSEHHGAADGYLPSPFVFAGAVAARTTQARIGISASVLTLRDPVLTAEDVIVLDHVSGGRIEVTCVAGYVPDEFEMFGIDFDERASVFEEKVEALTRALTGEPFHYRGRRGRVTPGPLQTPRPPVMLGGATHRAARRAAQFADGFVPPILDEGINATYLAECERLGKVPNLYRGGGPLFVHVTDDPDKAWAAIAPHAMHEMNSYGKWSSASNSTMAYEPIDDADTLRAHGLYAVFTPDECIAFAKQLGPHGSVMLHPLMGGLPPDLSWESLELFAGKVLPHI